MYYTNYPNAIEPFGALNIFGCIVRLIILILMYYFLIKAATERKFKSFFISFAALFVISLLFSRYFFITNAYDPIEISSFSPIYFGFMHNYIAGIIILLTIALVTVICVKEVNLFPLLGLSVLYLLPIIGYFTKIDLLIDALGEEIILNPFLNYGYALKIFDLDLSFIFVFFPFVLCLIALIFTSIQKTKTFTRIK